MNAASTQQDARPCLNRWLVTDGYRTALAVFRNAMNSAVTDCSSAETVSSARSAAGPLGIVVPRGAAGASYTCGLRLHRDLPVLRGRGRNLSGTRDPRVAGSG